MPDEHDNDTDQPVEDEATEETAARVPEPPEKQPRVTIGPDDEDEPEDGEIDAVAKPETTASRDRPAARTGPEGSASGTIEASGSSRSRPSFDEDERTPRPRHWGLPTWGWVLIIGTAVSALLLVLDLSNRNRYLMVCKAKKVELHKGRSFPWPFGHAAMGGPEFKPVPIPAEADCRTRVFHSQEEAELAFLDFILAQVREALANPGTADLSKARVKIRQALLLTRVHRSRRKEAQKMLAELAYRSGRAGLARAENELRKALARFQEAQKLDADKFEDLEDWITHLEELLRTVSPSPGSSVTRPTLLPGGSLPPMTRPPLPGLPGSTRPPSSAPALPASPDAGAPASGGGILM